MLAAECFNWQSRIADEEVEQVLTGAIAQGLGGIRPALMFHNLDALANRFRCLKSCFPPQTLHALAIKANPLVSLLRFAVECGMGLEAASIEEVALARAAGCMPDRIVFDSPAKTRHEISQALSWGVTLNADNIQELARINNILEPQTATASLIGLRVNPQVGVGNISILSVSGQYSKFGVPLKENREEIIAAFIQYPWLRALHVHVGSQGVSEQLMASAVAIVFELREEIHARLGESRINTVDIGGGLPWGYRPDDILATPASYYETLTNIAPLALSSDVRLVTEFGRTLQAGSGFAASRVEYLKTNSDRRTAVIHFGADLMMRKVYHPNDWYHHITVLDSDAKLKKGNEVNHTIVGPLCFGGDILAENVNLPQIEEGDWIVFHDTGAYTLSLWSRHCNRGLPAVFGYTLNQLQFSLLFPGESPEDVVRFWGGHCSDL